MTARTPLKYSEDDGRTAPRISWLAAVSRLLAAAFGLLPQWAGYFKKQRVTELPPYFKALSTRNPAASMAAFVAMSATSSSAGGAAAGAAGAGAAGGGAAGAG